METTNAISWWTCLGCGTEAEFETELTGSGLALPCPDCEHDMTERVVWESAAA